MFTYSKLAQSGIAALSYLAQVSGEDRLASSAEVAAARELSPVLVAKVLSLLSTAGLLTGRSGPTGGYRLARSPSEITMLDVIKVFDDPQKLPMCPFGPQWCGTGPNCPLHDTLFELRDNMFDRLGKETFEQFRQS